MFNLFGSKPLRSTPAPQMAEEDHQEAAPEQSLTPRYKGLAPKDRWDQIEFAFESGGTNYFRFSAEVNVPFQRAVAARDIFTEELWQINPDYLRGWNNGLINLLMDKKKKDEKKLYEIGILASRLKEQMDLSVSFIRHMKLATVIYFDEQENPLDYQYPYNKAKMEHWMKHNDVPAFFLKLPEYAYLPSLTEYSMNFPTYLQAESLESLNNLKHIIGLQLPDSIDNGLMSALESQVEMLEKLNTWSKGQSMSTT
jgi:hypothetical protein